MCTLSNVPKLSLVAQRIPLQCHYQRHTPQHHLGNVVYSHPHYDLPHQLSFSDPEYLGRALAQQH
jgi:hypothetical protein